MKPRTIIMLSAPRCGARVLCRMFGRHPEVHAPSVPNFWDSAAAALEGRPERFAARLVRDYPFLVMPAVFTPETIFQLWDALLRKYGPVVCETTVSYLGNRKATALLKTYADAGNDVRLFALIRDPRDAITSQFELRGAGLLNASVEKTEALWLKRFDHLRELHNDYGVIPLFRYEDLTREPGRHMPALLDYCGLTDYAPAYEGLRPHHIGRHRVTLNRRLRQWIMSDGFIRCLEGWGYGNRKRPVLETVLLWCRLLPGNIIREYRCARRRARRRKKRKAASAAAGL